MKRFLLTVLSGLLLAPSGFAILDTNHNGVSDLWEKAQNNGELFPGTLDSQADPDLDGWTNAQEAAAGTNPFDPNPPDGLIRPEVAHIPAVLGEPDENGVPTVITPEAVTVTWPTIVGKQYTLLFSPDLTEGSWIPVGDSFIGTGNEVTYGFEVSDSDKRFWRVSVGNVDTDSDGLSNHEEFLVGTNPTILDSDGDTLSDSAELIAGTDPLQTDADGDGWMDSQEIAAGTDSRNQDSDGDGIPDPIDSQPLVGALAFPDADGDGIADSDDAAPNDPRGPAPTIISETAAGNPVSNLVKAETARFILSVTNPSGPAPTASNLTLFLNGTEETASITAIGSPGASSQRFLLTWTSQTTTDYPTRTLQNLALRFRDAQMATTWLKLARIDVAEWEGYIAMAPVRHTETDGNNIDLEIESHINGRRYADFFGNSRGVCECYYRGPRSISVRNQASHAPIAAFQISEGAKSPLFITRFTAEGISNTSTIDAGNFTSYPHNSAWFFNHTASPLRYDWGNIVTEVGGNSTGLAEYGDSWGASEIAVDWLADPLRAICRSTWQHEWPFIATMDRQVHAAYPLNGSPWVTAYGLTLRSKLPASITPHLAGTVEVPGLPLHPLAIEKEGILFPVASETYHQILYKVDPAAGVWTAGIKLHLGRTSGQDTTPQTGIDLYDFTSGVPEPVSLDASGDLLLSPTQNTVLYQKLTSSGGLPLFLKRTSTADQPHTLEIRFVSKYEANKETTVAAVSVVPVEIVLDCNRDGMINGEDSGMASDENPFVFWINDDDDENEQPHFGDIPRQDVDNADGVVNGKRDLVDFFPVQLRIEKLLELLPPAEYSYRVSHPTGALNFIEMPNVLPDSQRINGAGSYLADETKATEAIARPLNDTAGNGSELSAEYLDAVKNGMGILLFESKAATNQSFELIVFRRSDNSEMARIPSEAWMNLVPVEDMFWYVNIRDAVNPNCTQPFIKVAQNERFRKSRKNRWFVFCHGYNVSAEAARGWNAEIFKRLHQMGCDFKFLGVTWEGNQGRLSSSIPLAGGFAPDYWRNVYNAFSSSQALATLVNDLSGGGKVVAGHSLGNMLMGSAICDKGLNAENYFMLNAAVPREAYFIGHIATDRNSVRNPTFQPYSPRLWSSDWKKLFPNSDGRAGLTWQGRFGDLANKTTPHNYYSTGEEVAKSGNGNVPGALDLSLGSSAWIMQEMSKGKATKAFVTGMGTGNWSANGGWEFNPNHYQQYRPNPLHPPGDTLPDTAAITNAQLMANPFFKPFTKLKVENGVAIPDSTNGIDLASAQGSVHAANYAVKAWLLAHDVPAISNPAASQPLDPSMIGADGNTNMNGSFKTGNWGDWKHSDMKEQPLDRVWKLYKDMVTRGELKK